ncbi:MAG: glycosyltransferase family 87 protein [Flavobacteriales bacterium]
MRDFLEKHILRPRFVLFFYTLLVIVASVHDWSQPGPFRNGAQHTHYNNYVIFTNASEHLLEGKDLYVHYPTEQNDLYKYSPVFALFMWPFSLLPDVVGLSLWNLLNALVLVFALLKIQIFTERQRSFIALLLVFDILTACQNAQTNAMVAGLGLMAYNSVVSRSSGSFSVSVASNFAIKIYGVIFGFVCLFRERWLRSSLYTMLVILFALAVPYFLFPSEYVSGQYSRWLHLMSNDQSASEGRSVMGIFESWFGLSLPKTLTLIASFLPYPLMLLFRPRFQDSRLLLNLLASLLIWIVIFNHKAESNTYVISMTGVFLWFFLKQKRLWYHYVLLVWCFVLVSLSPTDLFPQSINRALVQPYSLKALPSLFVWLLSIYELIAASGFCLRPQLTLAR